MLDVETKSDAVDAIRDLVTRFDTDVIDVPGGSARIRLEASGAAWDVLIDDGSAEVRGAERRIGPDCLLAADPAAWRHFGRAGYRCAGTSTSAWDFSQRRAA